MVETLTDWEGDWPMGFTKTPPGSSFPNRLHFSPEHVGFTAIGAVCNLRNEIVASTEAGIAELQRWSIDPLPKLQCGDVVTVQLHGSGHLSRYLNGKLLYTIATGMKPEGTWYGAFEVSMSVSGVCLLDQDPLPVQSAEIKKESHVNQFQAAAKQSVDILNVDTRNPQSC